MAYVTKLRESREEEIRHAQEMVRGKLPDIFRMGEFEKHLDLASRLYRFSSTNQILIGLQKPDATILNSYGGWQSIGRQVSRGEHGIKLFFHSKDGGTSTVVGFDVGQTTGKEFNSKKYDPEKTQSAVMAATPYLLQNSETMAALKEWAKKAAGEPTGGDYFLEDLKAAAAAYIAAKHYGLEPEAVFTQPHENLCRNVPAEDLHIFLVELREKSKTMIEQIGTALDTIETLDMEGDKRTAGNKSPTSEKDAKVPDSIKEPDVTGLHSKENAQKDTSTSKKKDKSKIVDFGEKIGGARKDMWAGRGLAIEDLQKMNGAERVSFVKKANIWPNPDYHKLVEEGLPKEAAYFIKKVKDSLAAAPQVGAHMTIEEINKRQESYVGFISAIRDQVMAIRNLGQANKLMAFLSDNGYMKETGLYRVEPTEKAAGCLTNRFLRAAQSCNRPRKLITEMEDKQFLMDDTEKKLSKYMILEMDSSCMEIKDNVLSIHIGCGTNFFYPDQTCSPLSNLEDKHWLVLRNNKILDVGFASRETAQEYALSLESRKEEENRASRSASRKKTLKPPMLEHIERTGGPIYRENGRNATGEDFLHDFGFRGGEFGNWLSEKDRQGSLNFAYDAMKDLARAAGISDRDVALEGKLAIAFGARGQGKALAHYEPLRAVINLTKMKGAGSLAHEWAHAMDDMIGKKVGAGGMMSKNPDAKGVPESFKTLMKAIQSRKPTEEEHFARLQMILDRDISTFRRFLNSISKHWPDQKLEQTRQELIEKIIEEAEASTGYDHKTITESHGKLQFVEDDAPSPAYRAFCQFQAQHGDTAPSSKQQILCANRIRSDISSHTDDLAHPEKVHPVNIKTDFAKQAELLDSSFTRSGHGYYASPEEMLARAAAAYIKDRLAEMGIRNDYLCGHADSTPVQIDSVLCHTSPQGNERKAINTAFDNFFEEARKLGLFAMALDHAIEIAEASGLAAYKVSNGIINRAERKNEECL